MTSSGEDPEDDEVVTQQTFDRNRIKAPEFPYRKALRTRLRETGVSVFRGRVSARDATAYILTARNRPTEPTDDEKPGIAVRRLSTRKLEAAGFVIVSNAGSVSYPEHCEVTWSASPLGPPEREWPPEVQEAFDACSTGEEEGWQ
jgi:hypothetical protein